MGNKIECRKKSRNFSTSCDVSNDDSTLNFKVFDIIAGLCGLATYESRHNPLLKKIQKSILLISFVLIIYSIILQIIFCLKTGFTSLQLAVLTHDVVVSKILWDADRNGHKMDQLIILLNMQLGSRYKCRIQRTQLGLSIFIIMVFLIDFVYTSFYMFTVSGLSKDAEMILHGNRNIHGNKLLLFFSALNLNNIVLISFTSTFYYIMIQLLLKYYSMECERRFPSMVRSLNIFSIKRNCQFFNLVRRVSNETMGFIPFTFFAIKWMSFVFGLTMIIQNKDKFSSGSTLLILLGTILTTTFLLFGIIETVHTTDSKMNHSRRIVREFLNENICNTSLLNEWKCLKNYLREEPIVPAMVWHFFELHPSLILISYNSMATFSVMVLTTLSAYIS